MGHKVEVAAQVEYLAPIAFNAGDPEANLTNVYPGNLFDCRVRANPKDSLYARGVVGIGYSRNTPAPTNYSNAMRFDVDPNDPTLFSKRIGFMFPPAAGDQYCTAASPFPVDNVSVWAFYPMVSGPYSNRFSAKCVVAARASHSHNEPQAVYAARSLVDSGDALAKRPHWLHYDDLSPNPANDWNGWRLCSPNGQPLRASNVLVFAPDVRWRNSSQSGSLVRRPWGNSANLAGDAWRFTIAPPNAIVIWQEAGVVATVTAQRRREAVSIDLLPDRDIYVHVNDKLFEYDDNTGAYSIRIGLNV